MGSYLAIARIAAFAQKVEKRTYGQDSSSLRGDNACMRGITVSAALLISALFACSTAEATEVLVSNYFGDTVGRYDIATGGFLGNLGGAAIDGPLATRVGPDGLVYVSSEVNNRILRYNSSSLAYVDTFATGTGLNSPTGTAFDGAGNVLVANFANSTVAKFNSSGVFQGNIVPSGSGGLNGPDVGITVGPDGILYVPSFDSNQILKYDKTTGSFLGIFAGPGGAANLTQPRTLIWKNNMVWVTSDNGNKVLRYDLNGSYIDTFVASGAGGLNGAVGMIFDDSGNLLVSSWRNNRVLRFNGSTGAYMNDFISSGLSGPVFLTTVPEPFSLATLGLGVLMMHRARKRKYSKE